MSAPCARTVMAQSPVGSVEGCSCGAVHLCVGPVCLRLEVNTFLALCDLVATAHARMTGAACQRAWSGASPWCSSSGEPS